MGALPLDALGRVLLGRRGIEPLKGDWNVIGGFLQYGEDPFLGLQREVYEELGVHCDVKRFVTMAADTYGPDGSALLNAYFTVELLSDAVQARDDVVELGWFPLDALPDNLAFESDRHALRTLLEQRKLPNEGGESQ